MHLCIRTEEGRVFDVLDAPLCYIDFGKEDHRNMIVEATQQAKESVESGCDDNYGRPPLRLQD